MNLNLKADIERVTLDDLIELENPGRSVKFIRDFLSRFVCNDLNEYMEEEEARKTVGKLNLTEAREAVEQLGNALRGIQDSSIPLAKDSA